MTVFFAGSSFLEISPNKHGCQNCFSRFFPIIILGITFVFFRHVSKGKFTHHHPPDQNLGVLNASELARRRGVVLPSTRWARVFPPPPSLTGSSCHPKAGELPCWSELPGIPGISDGKLGELFSEKMLVGCIGHI